MYNAIMKSLEEHAKEFAKECMEQEPQSRFIPFTFLDGDGFKIGKDEYIVVTFARKRFTSYPEEKATIASAVTV